MNWIRKQLAAVITLVAMLIAIGVTYGAMAAKQAEMSEALRCKADKEAIVRELDQVDKRFDRIEQKIDRLLAAQQ
jgi:hypothetical protein